MWDIVLRIGMAALAAAWAACNNSEDETTAPDAGPTEPEMPDATVQKDVFVRPDRAQIEPDGPLTRDAGVEPDIYISPDAGPDAESDTASDAGPPPLPRADVNIASGTRLAFFLADFEAAEGFLYDVELSPLGEPTFINTIDSSDVLLRYQEGKLYAIDRTNGEIHAYDDDLNFESTIDVSFGTNPQDIVVLPGGEKAYVSRLQPQYDTSNTDDVWIINPETKLSEGIGLDDSGLGGALSEIRLASATEGYVITIASFINYKIASFNHETMSVLSTSVYTSPSTYLPDFTIDALGRLVIAERGTISEKTGDPEGRGIWVGEDFIETDLEPMSLAIRP